MEQEKINRINQLAKKSRTPAGLTPREKEEQAALRQEYVAAYRRDLEAQLKGIVVVEPDGTRHKLPQKP